MKSPPHSNLVTVSAQGTRQFGQRLASWLKPGDILGLVGDLGAGKTCLVQGLAEGMGIVGRETVRSPTFTLLNEYATTPVLRHFDLYRIADYDELFEIGFEDYPYGNAICAIEWFDQLTPMGGLPLHHLGLRLDFTDNGRLIRWRGHGDRYEDTVEHLNQFAKLVGGP